MIHTIFHYIASFERLVAHCPNIISLISAIGVFLLPFATVFGVSTVTKNLRIERKSNAIDSTIDLSVKAHNIAINFAITGQLDDDKITAFKFDLESKRQISTVNAKYFNYKEKAIFCNTFIRIDLLMNCLKVLTTPIDPNNRGEVAVLDTNKTLFKSLLTGFNESRNALDKIIIK